MTYESRINLSVTKWENVARALYDVRAMYTDLEHSETAFCNNILDGTDVEGWQVRLIEKTLLAVQAHAQGVLKDLRDVGVIATQPGEVEVFLPEVSDTEDDDDDEVSRAIGRVLVRIEHVMSRVGLLDTIHGEARSEVGRRHARSEDCIPAEDIAEHLLFLDAVVPLALDQVKNLRTVVPA